MDTWKVQKEKEMKKKPWSPDRYIFGALRKIWRWHPIRRQAIKEASTIDSFGNKVVKCAECFTLYPEKQVQVDHIKPVVDPKTGFKDWNTYVNRLLYVKLSDVQVLCKICHKHKTKAEGKIRTQRRRKK